MHDMLLILPRLKSWVSESMSSQHCLRNICCLKTAVLNNVADKREPSTALKVLFIISLLLIFVTGINIIQDIPEMFNGHVGITGYVVVGSNVTILPGQWAVVSKNTLNDVLWRSGGLTITQIKGGNTNPENYYAAWNSGAFDPTTKKLWIAAQGGDGDGADNGVYAFDITTGFWSMISPPTVNLIPPYPSTGTWPYVDTAGTYGPVGKAYPQSRHTYGGSIIIPGVGIWIGGGVSWHPYSIVQTNIQKTWHATSSGWQGPFDLVGSYETQWGAWDSIKNRVLYQDNDRLRAYDPMKPSGSRVVAIDDGSQPSDSRNRFCSGAFDSKRNRLVGACVKSVSDGTPTLEGFNLSLSPTKRQTFIISASWPAWTTAPGFIYDPVGDKYVLWPNGGAKLYIIDPTTFTVTTIVGGGINPGFPASPYAGTWGRFAYVPGDDIYLLSHKVVGSVYAFRPDRNGTLPTPLPTISFYASPTSITSGLSTTLIWTTTDTTSCTASGAWTEAKGISGNQTVSPITTTTYTLTCTGPGGTTTQSTIVTVTAPTDTIAPTVSITSPSDGATVFNTTSITATASDIIGVVGVQFKLDGTNLGSEDTTSPYSYSFDTKTASNGAHILTATARDAAGNTATDSVNVTVSNSIDSTPGQIDIPTRVFVMLAMPARDKGANAAQTKHTTFAWNPTNGRLYGVGGDYGATKYENSYRQEIWSLSIAERFANPTNSAAGWRLEQPYCRTDGTVQLKHPDFGGWTWDSSRNIFWWAPGVMEASPNDNCPGETSNRWSDPLFLAFHVMSFDPITKKWTDYDSNGGPNYLDSWKSHYDPVTDSLIRFGADGGIGTVVNIYDIKSKAWTKIGLGTDALGKTPVINKEGSDIDLENRVIYSVDGCRGRLHRYNISSRTLKDLGRVPGGVVNNCVTTNDAYVAWDSIHKVLFFWRIDTETLHVYNPSNSTWENITTVTSPLGKTPRVRHSFVFDPGQNVLVMLGFSDSSNNNMYLFRYAPGAGEPILDTTPPTVSITSPSAGSNLSGIVIVSATASDDSGVVVGVQFKLDGTSLGMEDTTSPYSVSWNTNMTLNGLHTLTSTARDAAGNTNTSAPISITVSNLEDINATNAGDINDDKIVDIFDIIIVGSYLGQSTFDSRADSAPPFGTIDLFDVMVVVINWGRTY